MKDIGWCEITQSLMVTFIMHPNDFDCDDIFDDADNCPETPNSAQEDNDGDGIGDVCDNCLHVTNPNQEDADGDGIGDACECKVDEDCIQPYVCLDQCVMPDVTLAIEDGSGFRGTTNNTVTLNLDNQADKIGVLQVDICDEDNYLTCTGYEITERTSMFYCGCVELPSGCCRIVMYSVEPNTAIQEGDGPIAVLKYAVLEEALAGECRGLNIKGEQFVDENNEPLVVKSLSGQFCFASENEAIPTTSEWGMIIFMTIIMLIAAMALRKRRTM
jgi:hypothetical protein